MRIFLFYRKQIIDDWKSGLFKDKEIWERYGMSENAFYDLLKRFSKENENGLKDKSKKPKNPFRKLGMDEVKRIKRFNEFCHSWGSQNCS
ncbi:MAG: helix-turn-helix domain-containing protein [Euryarchaeota archaeon]|nr:helix-turn-helix domain-containing protein [Euryarchaeota archaeon]